MKLFDSIKLISIKYYLKSQLVKRKVSTKLSTMKYFGIILLALNQLASAEQSRGLLFCDGDDRVFYYLYTDRNAEVAQIISSQNLSLIEYSNYKPNCSTNIVVHGWMSSALESCTQVIKNGYLSSSEYDCLNIFLVDWSDCASNLDYFGPAFFVDNIGQRVSSLIEYLIENLSTSIDKIHLIGHSLGSHVAGFAGKSLQTKGMKLVWITGLDPAAPLFYPVPPGHRLSSRDGLCVETLHTTQGIGFPCELGTASYFVNGGTLQPGCKQNSSLLTVGACSHTLACFYYAEAVRLNTKNKYFAEKCKSRNCCDSKADPEQKPGTNSTCKTPGILAFNTNAYTSNNQYDFGIGPDGAVPCSGRDCYQNDIFIPCSGKTCDNVDFIGNNADEEIC